MNQNALICIYIYIQCIVLVRYEIAGKTLRTMDCLFATIHASASHGIFGSP